MKVLQVIDFLPETSGGARFVVNLANKLKSKNVNVDVLLIDGKKSHFLEELKNNNIEVLKISENINRFNFFYAFKISKYLHQYDVVHVHIFPTSYQVSIAKIFNKNSAPIVFTEHASYNRRASNFFFKYIEAFMYSRFSKIICLSSQVFDFLNKNLPLNIEKYKVIQNAIDTNAIFNSVAFSRESLGLKESDFILLMSARFDQPKRQDLLIEVLSSLPENIKVIFAGDGKNLEILKNKVLDLSLSKRVIFLGARKDIFSLMKMTDINILVSNYEGLSLAALEAMSTGKPFIASNVEGLDFVVNNKEYLFDNNVASLKEIILKLYNDKVFYNNSVSNSLLQSSNFDIDIMVESYINVYAELIEMKGAL